MSFNAPNLVSLDYSNYAMCECSPVNFESLVEARLNLRFTRKTVRPDISGLILHLSSDAVNVIYQSVKHDRLVLPVFNNLVSLSFGSEYMFGWRLLPYLLKQSPKLETLIIQDLNGYTRDKLLQVVIAQDVVVDDDGIMLEMEKDLMTTLLGVSVSSTCKIEFA